MPAFFSWQGKEHLCKCLEIIFRSVSGKTDEKPTLGSSSESYLVEYGILQNPSVLCHLLRGPVESFSRNQDEKILV